MLPYLLATIRSLRGPRPPKTIASTLPRTSSEENASSGDTNLSSSADTECHLSMGFAKCLRLLHMRYQPQGTS
jgi:hypothetical protein